MKNVWMMLVLILASGCASTDYVPRQSPLARLVQEDNQVLILKNGQKRAPKDNFGPLLECSQEANKAAQVGSKLVREGQDFVAVGNVLAGLGIALPAAPIFIFLGRRDISNGWISVVNALNLHNDEPQCLGGV